MLLTGLGAVVVLLAGGFTIYSASKAVEGN